jgi:hypothetical protein
MITLTGLDYPSFNYLPVKFEESAEIMRKRSRWGQKKIAVQKYELRDNVRKKSVQKSATWMSSIKSHETRRFYLRD